MMSNEGVLKPRLSRAVADLTGRVVVRLGHGKVVVYPTNSDVVEVEALVSGPREKSVDAQLVLSEGDLVVGLREEHEGDDITLFVWIPQDLALDVRTASSDVLVSGAGNDPALPGANTLGRGSIRVSTGSGGISIERPSETLVVRTESGDVEVAGDALTAYPRSLDVRTGSGRVSLEDVRGSVGVKTSSGDVVVRRGHGAESSEMSVSTASGFVTLEDHDAGARINTESGDVSIRCLPTATQSRRFDISSGSGRIALHDVLGSCSLSTKSGDAMVSIRGAFANADAAIRTGTGNINVFVPSDATVRLRAKTRGNLCDRLLDDCKLSDGVESALAEISLNLRSDNGDVVIQGR